MSIIKDFIGKFRGRQEKERVLEEDIRVQERVMEKKKSANERELEGYMKENREKMIKNKLERIRKQKSKEMWKASLMKNNAKCYIDNSLMKDKKNFLSSGYKTW